MAETSSHTLKNKEVVAVICNMMKMVFFDNTRVNAKRTFRDAEEGKTLRLPALKMQDQSEVPIRLKMDVSKFNGSLSFSYFRNHLGALLNRIAQQMEKDEVPILVAEDRQQRIVNLPVGHEANGQVNVMAVGFNSGKDGLQINLMFLEPSQFQRKVKAAQRKPCLLLMNRGTDPGFFMGST